MNCFSRSGSRSMAAKVFGHCREQVRLLTADGRERAGRVGRAPRRSRAGRSPESASVRATGSRWANSRGSSSIARPRSAPRKASALPKPSRFCWDAARVGSSKMPNRSSSSTGTFACRAGSVSPEARRRPDFPSCRSMYFRPSAERLRITARVSAGWRPVALSSLRVRSAPVSPLADRDGLDRGDDADAEAAGADLVAPDDVRRRSAAARAASSSARTAARCWRCRPGTRRR